MERFKRAMKCVAMMLSLCFVFALSTTVMAAETRYAANTVYVNPTIANGAYVSVDKMRMGTYSAGEIEVNEEGEIEVSEGVIEVVFPKGAAVTNVTTNKKALSAKLCRYDNWERSYYDETTGNELYGYGRAYIALTSTKKGTYKVSFNVNGAAYTVKVFVTKFSGAPVTKVTLDGKVVGQAKFSGNEKKNTYEEKSNYKVSSKTEAAKIKITPDSGIKVTGLVTAYADKDGVVKYKAVKNGKTMKLSKGYTNVFKAELGGKMRDARKLTKVFVSYKDKSMKTSVKYSVTKKHGVKQIKKVVKAVTGVKYVSYIDFTNGSNNDNLSNYYGAGALTFFAY